MIRWFDTSAFEPQPLFTLGNTLLNVMHGPGFASLDLSIFKDFVPRNETRIQFRIEAFNITNRANFGNPGSALGTSSFGVISLHVRPLFTFAARSRAVEKFVWYYNHERPHLSLGGMTPVDRRKLYFRQAT